MTLRTVLAADSPSVYYYFDETSGAFTNHGSSGGTSTNTGNITYTQTAPTRVGQGSAVQFNPTVITNATIGGGTMVSGTTWTFETWVKRSTMTNPWVRIVGNFLNGTSTSGTNYAEIAVIDDSATAVTGSVRLYDNTSGTQVAVTHATIGDLNWHHIAVVWNAGTATIYIDGVNAGSGTMTCASKTGNFLAGTRSVAGTAFYLDELAFFTSALSATQIAAHYGDVKPLPPAMSMTNLNVPTPVVSTPVPNVTVTPPAATLSMDTVTPVVTAGTGKTVTPPVMTLSMAMPAASTTTVSNVTPTADRDVDGNTGTMLTNATVKQAYVKFPSTPSGVATLTLTTGVAGTTQDATINVYRLTQDVVESATGTLTYDSSTSYGSFVVSNAAAVGTAYTVDISSLVSVWNNGTTNYGLALIDSTSGSHVSFATKENGTYAGPKLSVSVTPAVVSVTPPAMTMSMATATPVVSPGVGVTEALPPMVMSMTTAGIDVSTEQNINVAPTAMALSMSFPGGVPALPDFSTQATPMALGLSVSTPDVHVEVPAGAQALPMALSLDMAYAPTINLTTNVLKVVPVMTLSMSMVGIFDEAHDRYLNKLVGTLDADDIWYKLNETAGSTAVDSSVDTVNAGAWVQSGAYYGTLAPILDGPQLRKGVHFNGSSSFLRVGPYSTHDPEPVITTEMAMTVEFSIRTTQTDGVVFIGTGFENSTTHAPGPVITGNELRMEAGQLVLVNKAGHKLKVRKFVADGQWHHIVMSIPEFISGGGFAVDPDQPAYVMVDGDHALVRYNAFFGDAYGGYWLPFTVMARATTLSGSYAPNGFLAGDLSNFIVRLNNYIPTDEAQSIYYEWSDANVINPTPAQVTLSTPAPKVKGSVKKMLALYGLPFTREYVSPASGSPAHTMYNYLDVLSGMVIANLGGNSNLQATLGGSRYWPAPTPFMMDDYFVIPVSIFGNLNNSDAYAQSVNGTLNPDSPVTENGIFVNDETGHPRFINLQEDLSVNVTEEYEVITVVNYPWERPDDPSVDPENYVVPFHDFGTMTADQWETARDGLRDSIMEAVYDGCSMWIGDYYAAQHLGFIQGYDIHDFGRWANAVLPTDGSGRSGNIPNFTRTGGVKDTTVDSSGAFEFNAVAEAMDNDHLPVGNQSDLVGSGKGDYFAYPQANFYRRITALVPDLTDLPGNDYGQYVEGWNVDDFLPNGNFVAYDVLRRPDGYVLGDKVTMGTLWTGSKFFGEVTGTTSLSKPTARVAMTSAHPDGIRGTVVSREQEFYYGPNGVVFENPYKDNALTIAAEVGTLVNGRPIAGRVFIELMGTDWGRGYIGEDADKTKWHGSGAAEEGGRYSTWDYDSRREMELKNELSVQTFKMSDSQGGFKIETKTQYFFTYGNNKINMNLHLPMAYRGLHWLSKTPVLAPGEAKGYASPMTLTLTTPGATPSSVASPATQVHGAMRLDLEMRKIANYADGNTQERAFPMELSLEMRGLGRVVAVPAMSLSVTTVAPKLDVAADTITVYMDASRNITLFLKEDN